MKSSEKLRESVSDVETSEIKIDKSGYSIRDGKKAQELWDATIGSDKKPLRLKLRNICGDETVWEV